MAQKKDFWSRAWEWWAGKKEDVEYKNLLPPEAMKDAATFKKWAMQEAMKKPEKIGVPEVPTTEQLMPGGFPEIKQPEFSPFPEFSFADRKAEAEREFSTQDVPALAERFASMGKGAVSSPGFASTMSRAGAGLKSQLAGLEEQLGQQYAMGRGQVEAQQGRVGLMGQGMAADTAFQGGQFRKFPFQGGMQRADLQSTIQQRQKPNFGALGGYAFQPTQEAFFRPAAPGAAQQGAKFAARMAALYFGGGF